MAARADDEPTPEAVLLRLHGQARPGVSGVAPRPTEEDSAAFEAPTRRMDRGPIAFLSRIDEVRRLYAEGAADEALLLANTIAPAPAGWSLASVPVVLRTREELLLLQLDHVSGFLLSHVDGETSLETILDLVPVPESEALAIVESLLALDVIAFVTR